MSRWKLLKSSLMSGRRDTGEGSIHSFIGDIGRLLNSRKIIWQGFVFDHEVDFELSDEEQMSRLQEAAIKFTHNADCAEIVVNLFAVGNRCNNGEDRRASLMKQLLCETVLPPGIKISILSHELVMGESTRFAPPHRVLLGKIQITHDTLVPLLSRANFIKYTVPHSNCDVFVRERPKDMSVGVNGLLSNMLHGGIDNTGNVRVWEAEQILLFYLAEKVSSGELNLSSKCILELGGGMTALAGLGLARLCRQKGFNKSYFAITDGHPDCVRNQKVCLAMNHSMDRKDETADAEVTLTPASSFLLRWSRGDLYGDLDIVIQNNPKQKFDVIIAADCLFFRDFHDDLLWVLDNALDQTDGVVYCLQPRRGDTMATFLAKAELIFLVQIIENFSDDISNQIQRAVEANPHAFNADVHNPILCVLSRRV